MGLRGAWGDTALELPPLTPSWENVLTGERWESGPLPVRELLQRFPVALLRAVDRA
jgi:maltooligosyltrehalose synthase